MSANTLEALAPAFGVLDEIREMPCAICGETGDTLPCVKCDKLLCDNCGVDIRFCKEHPPSDYEGAT